MAPRTIGTVAIPGIVWWFVWFLVVVLLIILVAYIIHQAGGGNLALRLGHFVFNIGVT